MMYSMIPVRSHSRMYNDFGTFGSLMRLLDDFPTMSRSEFRTDILDCGDHYRLQAELPGLSKEEIQLSVKDGMLTISAQHDEQTEQEKQQFVCRERRFGSYSRSFSLEGIDEDAISAKYENGVLELLLPKVQPPQPETRQIEIQ